MTEPTAENRTQVLAAKRWMDDEAGMERASLGPAEYVAYRMKESAAEAEALVAAVYALESVRTLQATQTSSDGASADSVASFSTPAGWSRSQTSRAR